ncbi:MAG: hypothetical protein DLM70_08435 [Chloroflexi bacterium]|nr:MAG: hypothetical protein DLM70_08435 [Chloroflexota bacterium]
MILRENVFIIGVYPGHTMCTYHAGISGRHCRFAHPALQFAFIVDELAILRVRRAGDLERDGRAAT